MFTLGAQQCITSFNLHNFSVMGFTVFLILPMRKIRLTKVNPTAQHHQIKRFKQNLFDSRTYVLFIMSLGRIPSCTPKRREYIY